MGVFGLISCQTEVTLKSCAISCADDAFASAVKYSSLAFLSISLSKVFHKFDQFFHSFKWKSIIDRSPDAADRAMSFQTVQTAGCSFHTKLFLQIFGRQAKCDIHQ